MFPSPVVRLLLRRILVLLGFYFLLRIGFYLANFKAFDGIGAGPISLAFWHGFRFDLSAVLWLNLPVVALSVGLSLRWRPGQLGLRVLTVLLNLPGFAGNILDWEYFKFIGRRTSNELSTIGGDVLAQAGQILLGYWYLLLLCFGLLALLWWVFPMPTPAVATGPDPAPDGSIAALLAPAERRSPRHWRRLAGWVAEFSLLVFGVVLGLRGGLQFKPLRPGQAFQQSPAVLGHLALNSTFTLLKSFGDDDEALELRHYFASPAALRRALGAQPLPLRPTAPAAPAENVVLLLLESFGSEYNGVENGGQGGYTPFFDSLAVVPGAALLPTNYANGRRSIEAVPAVLSGLPALMEASYITSVYQTDELHGLGEILGRHGYATAMYHGGSNGTMGFDTFAGIAGMQHYYGLNEYPGGAGSPDYDGHWGIFDEPYLQYFNRQLGQTKTPFFATLFTLSAHEPFTLPPAYAAHGRPGTAGSWAGPLPIHATIRYADLALRRFFAAARQQPWYAHTTFILTADHASQTERAGYNNPLGAQRTPLLIFRPGRPLPPVRPDRISQQADVPATVLDLLGLRGEQRFLLPFGSSVFAAAAPGRSLFFAGTSYFLVHSDFVTELTADNVVRLYPYQPHFMPATPLANPDPARLRQYGNELRACVQFYANGLVENRLYK